MAGIKAKPNRGCLSLAPPSKSAAGHLSRYQPAVHALYRVAAAFCHELKYRRADGLLGVSLVVVNDLAGPRPWPDSVALSRKGDGDPGEADQVACTFSAGIAPRDLAHCFQRLANFDNGLFERLGRCESAFWRQMAQTLFLLQPARRR
jgi:hypothetical protein